MSAESPRHARAGGGGPLTVASQPPNDRGLIDAVSGFISDVTLSSSSAADPKDVIQWARFEVADINEPTPEGYSDNDISPLLLILGYGSGVQVWLIPPNGEAQEVLSWRQGTVRVLRILPTPQHGDCFTSKRPLIALCDSTGPGPAFCSLSFMSIRGGEQVKSIKFKNPILDVLANKRSVVVSFSERFAVFDAGSLEDRAAVTTCYPCPCPLGGTAPVNPLALGDRWLAYADKKLNSSKRSSGGCEGEGVASYTATVLHAAKSLSKGLRGLGESVAHSLGGGRGASQSPSPPHELQHPGVVTIIDLEGNDEEESQGGEEPYDPVVAHFIAHSEAIIALKFDDSGMLLVTADRRGHDFHVFRINPHPCSPALASVHHLYVLHRGDTTAKVQDIAISCDSRWAAISTLRGTTHVFALSPYGGATALRTHAGPRVVNRLSRFHRSAGLPIHEQRPGEPSTVSDTVSQSLWFPNPRLPPYPQPTTVTPLAQLRPTNLPTHTITRTSSGRQRLSSLSEEPLSAPLLARAWWGPVAARPPAAPPAAPTAALYRLSCAGVLLRTELRVRVQRGVPKEKICDESPIELEVEPVAQWSLQRGVADLLAPLHPSNPLLQPMDCRRCLDSCGSAEERWLSQVEIVTHAGPHRRLWMGPQFLFKHYTGSSSSLSEAEAVEVEALAGRARSNPVNMPGVRPLPVLVDSGSASSVEHSPSDSFRRKSLLTESGRASVCDVQLKEDLAEAMKEDSGDVLTHTGHACVERAVDPLGTVVRAGGAPPQGKPGPARSLPRAAHIPAVALPAMPLVAPLAAPLPLADIVTIPAARATLPPYCPPPAATPDRDLPIHQALYDLTPDLPEPELVLQCQINPEPVRELPPPEPKPVPVVEPELEPEIVPRRVKRERKHRTPTPVEVEVESPPAAAVVERQPSVEVSVEPPPREESFEMTSPEPPPPVPMPPPRVEIEIKTEEQAWDMLINEPPTVNVTRPIAVEPKPDETKTKPKKSRKSKKAEDSTVRADEDSFVEIHAIEDKQTVNSDQLVSISAPYEDSSGGYGCRRGSGGRRSHTPEREKSPCVATYDDFEPTLRKSCELHDPISVTDFEVSEPRVYEPVPIPRPKLSFKDSVSFDYRSKAHPDGTASETTSFIQREKAKKSKSLSPNPDDSRRTADKVSNVEKDVYVIDTTNEDFPEIQITSGVKGRKKSPQPAERKIPVKEVSVEAAPKSWSSIAASKNTKREEVVIKAQEEEPSDRVVIKDYSKSSREMSLHETFAQLYNRPDIVVAECGAPSELTFVEQHHALLDLPPLDFGLDDFKLEVMRDSLLDSKVTSPICKINIDDILNTISTSRDAFNLVELEKVPAKKERGFSVVEGHKITTQEVKLDEEFPGDVRGEKSSDEDATPVTSTDSDKEDKRVAGATDAVLPSLKQATKSKKSRRKKK